MKNLIKTIQNTIFQQALFARGTSLVLGISGGPDSMCLLDIFSKLQKKYDLRIILAHVNYELRGRDSDRDQELVEELAQKNNLELFVLRPKIKGKSNLEERLRDVRYEFFEKIRLENNFDLIAVAHTADDQVETFLMRVLRGAGLQGLAAMKYKNGKIIRPLLGVYKKEILEYLKKNKLKYRIDRTNKEMIFFRNKIRNKLIPMLEKDFNPNIKETILKMSLGIADDYSLVADLAKKHYAKVLLKNGDLSAEKILSLPVSLQKMVIREAIAKKKENLRDVSSANIEEILKIVKSSKGKSQVIVFGGLKVARKGDKISVNLYNK